MTWTPEQIAAYEKLDEAIEGMISAFNSFPDGEFLSGFVVAITGIRPIKGTELYEDDDDDDGSLSSSAYYYKRGQHPMLTRGIADNLLHRLREG